MPSLQLCQHGLFCELLTKVTVPQVALGFPVLAAAVEQVRIVGFVEPFSAC